MAYFDNAATTFPKPKEVYDFMNEFYRQNGASAGRGNYNSAAVAGELIHNTREALKELLHCPAKEIIFEPTATIALNIIIQGVIRKGACNVYITPFEHNAVTRTLHHFEENQSIRVTELAVNKDLSYDLERIKYQFDSLKPDFVIMTHASNVIGLISPVEEIFNLAKKYEAVTLVDMSQSAGLVDLNVGLQTIDFAVFAGHKTLYGPTGISGFAMNPSFDLPAVFFGGTGYESANQNMPKSLPQRFEFGTLNTAGVAGLYAALKWINQIGINNIWETEQKHRRILVDILSSHAYLKLVGTSKTARTVGIVSAQIRDLSSDVAGNVFNQQNISVRTGLQCAPLAHRFLGTYPSGTIRFSVSYFTSEQDYQDLEKCLTYIENNM